MHAGVEGPTSHITLSLEDGDHIGEYIKSSGKLYEEQKQPGRATTAYERALEMNPDLGQARSGLKRLRDQ